MADSDTPPLSPTVNSAAAFAASAAAASKALAPSKRQRLPSVRLDDVGAHPRRTRSATRRYRTVKSLPRPDEDRDTLASIRKGIKNAKKPPPHLGYVSDSDTQSESGGDKKMEFIRVFRVRAWLEGIGLGRYAPMFEIHEVDGEMLPIITLEDLKEMGITAVGPRRKMYNEIQKLKKRMK